MFIGGTWTGRTIREQAPNMRFGIMSFPRGPRGKRRGGVTWTNMICMPKDTKHPDLAWEYITYFAGLRNALWKLDATHATSPLAEFYETPQWKQAIRKEPWFGIVPHMTEVGGLYPVVRFTEINAILDPLFQGLMLNNLSPQQVLDRGQAKVDLVLDNYYTQLEESYR